jgi:hypothetical protein
LFADGGVLKMGGGPGGGGGQPTQTTVQNTNIPEYARPYVETMLGTAQQQIYNYDDTGTVTGFKPYIPYGATVDAAGNITNTAQEQAGAAVAPFSPLQQQAFRNTGTVGMPGQFNLGTGYQAMGGAGALNAGQNYNMMATNPYAQQAFMSPYMQNAVDVQKNEAIRDAQKGNIGANLGAARQGTYGGARQLLAEQERNRNLQTQLGNIQATGTQKAFETAQQAQQYGANLGLQGYGQAVGAGTALGQMGGQQLAAQQGIIGLQSQMGAQQQAQQQNYINQAIQNYAMQQQYPQQQLAFMSGLTRGLPLQTGTTQSYQAAPSAISQISGLGLTGAAAYGMMKKEGGVIKSYADGGDVAASAAAPASTRSINVPPPEGYKFDASTGQYNPTEQGGFSSLFPNDGGVLAKITRILQSGRSMAEGGEVENFVSGGIAQEITNKVRMNPDGYSKQAIDKSTKSGLVDDLVGLAAIQEKNKNEKERQAAAAMAQGTPPTVKDQILAERAALDQQRRQGIEMAQSNLPTEYAGGGIVAFDDGGGVQSDAAPADPWGQGLVNWWKSYTTGSPEALQRQGTLTPEQAVAARAKQDAIAKQAAEGNAAYMSGALDKPADKDELKVVRGTPNAKPTAPTTPAAPAGPGIDSSYAKEAGGIDDLIKQLAGDIKESGKSNAEARKEAKLMAMLQAGLGIMGGTSQYAAANFKGAIPALQGYQEEMRGIRADEAKQLSQISALNLKGAELKQELKKLGITEKHYADWLKVYSARGAGGAGKASYGSIPFKDMREVEAEYRSYLQNPKAVLASPLNTLIPPVTDPKNGWIRQGLEAKPGTQSYNNAMNEVAKIAEADKQRLYQKGALYGSKSPTIVQSSGILSPE